MTTESLIGKTREEQLAVVLEITKGQHDIPITQSGDYLVDLLKEVIALRQSEIPPDNVDRVAIALCSWLNGRKMENPADETLLGLSDHLKDQYRDQARSAIAAMGPQVDIVAVEKILASLLDKYNPYYAESNRGQARKTAVACAEAWGLAWK
jgi:hypothetical protein